MPKLFACQLGTFTATLVGVTGTPTGPAYFAISPGGIVLLELPALLDTSDTTGAGLTGLPSFLWPARDQFVSLPQGVYDNGNNYPGGLLVGSTGGLTLYYRPTIDGGMTYTFTPTGDKGLEFGTVSYLLS